MPYLPLAVDHCQAVLASLLPAHVEHGEVVVVSSLGEKTAGGLFQHISSMEPTDICKIGEYEINIRNPRLY